MEKIALTIDQFGTIEPPGGLKIFGINSILQTFISFYLLAAIFISLTYIIWGGIDYIMSEGDKQRIQAARQKFIFAIIGLIIVLLSFFIIGTVGHIFGINFFGAPLGNIENPCINTRPEQPCKFGGIFVGKF